MIFKKYKNILYNIGIASVSFVLGLFLCEVILRIIGFHFEMYPSKVQFGWPDPEALKELYQADQALLWVPKDYYYKITQWIEKEPSIVFMGCSCTEGGNYDSFFGELLDQQYPTSSFAFVNIGVGGWSSYQGLQQLKRDVLPMKPRIVTIYYGWNDHWCNFGYDDKTIGKFNMEHSSLLQKFSKLRIVQLIYAALLKIGEGSNDNQRKTERVSLPDFTFNLTQMVRTAKNNGITPVLLTAPSSHIAGNEPVYLAERWLKNLNDLIPLHQSYVQAVRDVAFKEQVQLIDLYKEFRKLNYNDLSMLLQEDGIHLTEEGDKKIAEILFEEFRKSGLINRIVGILK